MLIDDTHNTVQLHNQTMKIYTQVAVAAAVACMTVAEMTAKTIEVTTPAATSVIVRPVSPTVVKVTNLEAGQTAPKSRASVLDNAGYDGGTVVDKNGNKVLTVDGTMTVTVTPGGAVTVSAPDGRTLVTDRGVRTIDGENGVELTIAGNGSLYGAGERGHRLNLRGDTLTMYNRQNYGYTGTDPRINQMNITMPLFLSNDGFAVVFDDYAASRMILGNTVKYTTESKAPVSYYVAVSRDGSLASLTESLTELTGRQELPPFWSMGYITSKYGYRTEAETEGVIDTLKTEGYPVDGIVLDLYWYGKEQDMGRLAWDSEQWPNPEKMLANLKSRGVNLVAISQPYVLRNGRGIENYMDLSSKSFFVTDSTGTAPQEVTIWVGEGGMFDVSNDGTRRWLADRYGKLTDMGITGWWGDLGEPEVHPETGLHANGLTARLYHNQYGNDWSEIIYDLFKTRYPDTRLMTMMRGGTTGLQRYDVFPWSTDVSRSWGGLEPQITIMTQSGLSGLGYMGHDVGGFAVDPENPYDPELYVRWLQLGLFTPILRTHAQQFAEPYKYPEQHDIILPLIKERYRWLPYNYTLAWENATKGYPLVRPLEFKSIAPTGAYDTIRDQFMWGDGVMVAPVMKKGATTRTVVFPTTSSVWIDMADPTRTYAGGAMATVDAPLDVLPVFVRGGTFIPMADYPMNNTLDYRTDRYTINYYPARGVVSDYTLFEDDRTTPSAKSGNKGLCINFAGDCTDSDQYVVTVSSEGEYPGMTTTKSLDLVLHGVSKQPRKVTVNDTKTDFTYDKTKRSVRVAFSYETGTSTKIVIK